MPLGSLDQHRRDDPGRAVGRRRDHPAAGSVLLLHGEGVGLRPSDGGVPHVHRSPVNLVQQFERPALDAEAAGEFAPGRGSGLDALLERLPHQVEVGGRRCTVIGVQLPLIGQDHRAEGPADPARLREEGGGVAEGMRYRAGLAGAVAVRHLLGPTDEPAADRTPGLAEHDRLTLVQVEHQGVGVRQRLAPGVPRPQKPDIVGIKRDPHAV